MVYIQGRWSPLALTSLSYNLLTYLEVLLFTLSLIDMAFPLNLGFLEAEPILGVEVSVDLSYCHHASNGDFSLYWVLVGPIAEPVGAGDKVFLLERVHLGLMTRGGCYGSRGPGSPPWGMEGVIGHRGVRVTAQGVQFRVYPRGTSRAFIDQVYLIIPRPQARLGIYGRLIFWLAQLRGDLPSGEPTHCSLTALRELRSDATDTSAEGSLCDSGNGIETGSDTCTVFLRESSDRG